MTRFRRHASAGTIEPRSGAIERPQARPKTFARLIGAAGMVAITLVLFWLLTDDSFRVSGASVRFDGLRYADEATVRGHLAELDREPNVFRVRADDIVSTVAVMPEIDAAAATVTLPAEVSVRLEEREPLFIWSDNRDEWLVDENGMLFGPRGSPTAEEAGAGDAGDGTGADVGASDIPGDSGPAGEGSDPADDESGTADDESGPTDDESDPADEGSGPTGDATGADDGAGGSLDESAPADANAPADDGAGGSLDERAPADANAPADDASAPTDDPDTDRAGVHLDLPRVLDERLSVDSPTVGTLLPEDDLHIMRHLLALTPELLGSDAEWLELRIDQGVGYELRSEAGWRAIFGHYSPRVQPLEAIPRQVQCLRALLAERGDKLRVVWLAVSETSCGTYK